MDVFRLDIYPDLAAAHRNSQRVFFNVFFLRVHGDWAVGDVLPVDGAGRDVAERRWELLHRVSDRWIDVHYEDALDKYYSIHRPPREMNDFDVIDMSDFVIPALCQIFPDAPRDIFPRPGSRPSGLSYSSIKR